MDDKMTKSILEMCNGAFQERADYEMRKLIDNIIDPNTDPVAKRSITIKIDLKPGQAPEAQFAVTEPVIAAYEYCNLHGLWKAEA